MTPERQRIAIAEWEGWSPGSWVEYASTCSGGVKSGRFWSHEGYTNRDGRVLKKLPDYLNSLDAIHEAVVAFKQTVNDPDRRWSDALMRVIQDHECCGAVEARYRTASATAAQRAEALLRTVGRWEEE